MKYLSGFLEELQFDSRNIPYKKVSDGKYTFATDGATYQVDFSKTYTFYKSAWTRGYDKVGNSKVDYHQANKNPFNIVSTVTNITEEFLTENDVDVLTIMHVNMNNESNPITKLNKRARMNYNYLKNIKGYQLRYFNQPYRGQQVYESVAESVSTNCVMFKIGTDISPIIKLWDNYKPHPEIFP